jgi:ABC-type oligopeptide transport system substrate-binding subunit
VAKDFRNKFKIIAILAFCPGLLFSTTSCAVYTQESAGKHKGWYKNSNNPHHPNSTNPGKSEGKSESKHKN